MTYFSIKNQWNNSIIDRKNGFANILMDNTLTKCTRIQCWLNCKEKKINKYNNWANCLVLRERFNEIWLDDGTIELILIEFAWQPLNIRENWLFASFLFETFKLKWTFFYDGKKTSEMPTKESENLLEKSMKRKKKIISLNRGGGNDWMCRKCFAPKKNGPSININSIECHVLYGFRVRNAESFYVEIIIEWYWLRHFIAKFAIFI